MEDCFVFAPRMTPLDHAAIAVSIPSRRFFSSLLTADVLAEEYDGEPYCVKHCELGCQSPPLQTAAAPHETTQ